MKSRYLPVVCAIGLGTRNPEPRRLAGQSSRLPVGGGFIEKPVAALPEEHVDHRALDIAELADAPTACTAS